MWCLSFIPLRFVRKLFTTWFWYSPNITFLCKTEVSAVRVIFPGHILLFWKITQNVLSQLFFPLFCWVQSSNLVEFPWVWFCCVQPTESCRGKTWVWKKQGLHSPPSASWSNSRTSTKSLCVVGQCLHPGSTEFWSLKIPPFHTVFKGVQRAAAVDAVSGSTLVSQILRSSPVSFC